MNERFRKLMASLVALLMTFSFITASAVAADKAPVIDHSQITVNQGISDFVTRLYDICLGRNPDPTGFKTWTEQLSNGENTGVGCAYGFIFSNEFQNKNVSNDQYIELMYNCFFGRASDPDGKANWLNAMNSGMTREELFLGFANSVEFFNLCKTYGITAGCHVLGKDYQKVAKINLFVERLYNIILSRPCDQAGMIDWSTRLANKEISGAQAAYGFIFSDEYRNKNRSDSDFLEDLYNAFMGRTSDPSGKANWQTALNNGSSDRDIFNGFTGSQEFIAICNDYGIDKGGDITSGQTSARAGRSPAPTQPTETQAPAPTQHVHNYVAVRTWTESDTVTHYFCQGIDFGLDYDAALAYQAANGGSVYSDAVETNVQTYTYYECSCGDSYVTSETQAPTPTPKPAPTISYYELNCTAFDDEDNQHSNTFTGSSKSDVRSQYTTWMDNHGYSGGSYNIYAVYSDGTKKPV